MHLLHLFQSYVDERREISTNICGVEATVPLSAVISTPLIHGDDGTSLGENKLMSSTSFDDGTLILRPDVRSGGTSGLSRAPISKAFF